MKDLRIGRQRTLARTANWHGRQFGVVCGHMAVVSGCVRGHMKVIGSVWKCVSPVCMYGVRTVCTGTSTTRSMMSRPFARSTLLQTCSNFLGEFTRTGTHPKRLLRARGVANADHSREQNEESVSGDSIEINPSK